MRWLVLRYSVVGLLVLFSGALLMDVSHRVQSVQRQVKSYDNLIESEKENIRVLKAEWAYLNDPLRLEEMVSGNSGFVAPQPENLVSDMDALFSQAPASQVFVNPSSASKPRDISYNPSIVPPPSKPIPASFSTKVNQNDLPNNYITEGGVR